MRGEPEVTSQSEGELRSDLLSSRPRSCLLPCGSVPTVLEPILLLSPTLQSPPPSLFSRGSKGRHLSNPGVRALGRQAWAAEIQKRELVPLVLTSPSVWDPLQRYRITCCLSFSLCQLLASVGRNHAWLLCREETGEEERKGGSNGKSKTMGACRGSAGVIYTWHLTRKVTGGVMPPRALTWTLRDPDLKAASSCQRATPAPSLDRHPHESPQPCPRPR